MPSNYTSRKRFEKQATGENINSWGDHDNTTFDRIDISIAGLKIIALTGDYTLTTSNTADDDARYAMLKFTGGAGPFTVTIPAIQGQYRIWNAASGTVTIASAGGGSSIQVATTDIIDIFCDATNVKTLGYGGSSLKDYIASVVVGGGASLPSLTGNAGKWLTNNGTIASWSNPATTDLSDLTTYTAARSAFAVAMAVAFGR